MPPRLPGSLNGNGGGLRRDGLCESVLARSKLTISVTDVSGTEVPKLNCAAVRFPVEAFKDRWR